MLDGKKIGFLGAGAMGQAIIKGLLQSGLVKKEQIIASVKSEKTCQELQEKFSLSIYQNNQQLVKEADIIILAVKPQILSTVLQEVEISVNKLLVSIAAGVTLANLEKMLQKPIPLVRVMPNTPCLVGEGASALALGTKASIDDGKVAEFIFSSVGKVITVPEKLLNAVTGLSGSGPAYIYMIIEALADGGVREGLSRQQALILAAQTVLGSAKMVLETGEHPGALKDKVTSPAGTTIEAVASLERNGLRNALLEAVTVASKKAEDLGK